MELLWHPAGSDVFNDREKVRIQKHLANRIDGEGILHLTASEERSQLRNKELVIQRFLKLIARALVPQKKRIPTKPGKATVEKRLALKKKRSLRKQQRSGRGGDE